MTLPEGPCVFEPLRDQDKKAFSCGVRELDDYLYLQASKDSQRKVAAPFVMLDRGGWILGYYTLSSYGINASELPPDVVKKLPRYPLLPATMLGPLAVSSSQRGKKLGRLLLMDALHRSWKNTLQVVSVGVIAEAYDDSARPFYLHHEFVPLADHPRKFFLAMRTIEKSLA